jgi:two-component system response regulator YesN
LVNSFATVILDMNGEIDEVFGSNYNLYLELGQLHSPTQTKQWFAEIMQKTILFIQKKRENKNIELLHQVTQYIEKHCSETLSLQMVADHIYMNSTYLSKMFKEITGTMFSEYLSEVRLKKACVLLTDTNKNVSEIAEAAGFGNKLNLIRTFKKQLGMTPTDYRKQFVLQRLE